MINLMKRLVDDESGVTAIEYGLIAAGIGVAILTVVNTVGGSLVTIFTTVANVPSTPRIGRAASNVGQSDRLRIAWRSCTVARGETLSPSPPPAPDSSEMPSTSTPNPASVLPCNRMPSSNVRLPFFTASSIGNVLA